MFNHKKYLTKYLTEYTNKTITDTLVPNIVAAHAVIPRYEIIGIHKLTSGENVGKHNLFIDVVDKNGSIMRDVRVAWGWEGQKPSEVTRPLVLDKPLSEPSGNLVIWSNQKIWAKLAGNIDSDEIRNIHTQLPDEGPGNTYGHHSYYIVWMLIEDDDDDTFPDEPNQELEELKLENKRLMLELEKSNNILVSISDLLDEWNQ